MSFADSPTGCVTETISPTSTASASSNPTNSADRSPKVSLLIRSIPSRIAWLYLCRPTRLTVDSRRGVVPASTPAASTSATSVNHGVLLVLVYSIRITVGICRSPPFFRRRDFSTMELAPKENTLDPGRSEISFSPESPSTAKQLA